MSAVYLGPRADDDLVHAVAATARVVLALGQAEVVIWTDSDPASFPADLPSSVRWVQLPGAGVERWIAAGRLDDQRTWTSMAGAYSEVVAEHAFAMLLAGVKGLPTMHRWRTWRRDDAFEHVGTLSGATVAMVGAGGIGRRLVALLNAVGADAIAVNHSGRTVPGARATLPVSSLDEALRGCDHLVIAAPATDKTRHLIGPDQIAQLPRHAWIVNVGRGSVLDQQALVDALEGQRIGGAALDVTDPEPLPDDHRLWRFDNVLITPHTANPPTLLRAALRRRVVDNLQRWQNGQPVQARIDIKAQY